MNTFKLNIVTPNDSMTIEDVTCLVADTSDGHIGILAYHAPLIATLKISLLEVHKQNETVIVAISGGFLEVSGKNDVTIIANTAETADEIDVERAQAAADLARKRLEEFQQHNIDFVRAENNLQKELLRLNASKYKKKP